MAYSSYSDLLILLSNKLGNQSQSYFLPKDRQMALNWARNMMAGFEFPVLEKVITLTFTPIVVRGQSIAKASLPTDFEGGHVKKVWDIYNNPYDFIIPNAFDAPTAMTYTLQNDDTGVQCLFTYPDTVTTLYMRYSKGVTQFADDGNQLNEFDSRYDDLITEGAVGQLQLKGKTYNDMQVFANEFQEKCRLAYNIEATKAGWDVRQKLTSVWASHSILQRSSIPPTPTT